MVLVPFAGLRRSVLIVEDNIHIRESFAMLFARRCWQVAAPPDSENARLCIQHNRFDLAVLDLHLDDQTPQQASGLPGGLQLLALLRRTSPRALVLMLSGSMTPALAAQCRAMGADHCLTKPVSMGRILGILAESRLPREAGTSQEASARLQDPCNWNPAY